MSLYLIKRFFSANSLQFRGGMMLLHALIFTINVAFYMWSAVTMLFSFVIITDRGIVANEDDLLDLWYRF